MIMEKQLGQWSKGTMNEKETFQSIPQYLVRRMIQVR
jgi:hypothetical protein